MQVLAAQTLYGGATRTNAPNAAPGSSGPLDSVHLGTRPEAAALPRLRRPEPPRALGPELVRKIASNPNPVLRNLQITDLYHDVALALRDMIGPEGGNNWPAWAGWASKHVGEHIRQEDLPILRGTCKVTSFLARTLLPASIQAAIWGPSVVMDRAHGAIARANKDIFERTCLQFTRFISTFQGDRAPDEAKWAEFARGFQPGSYEEGGEDLLRDGFRSYYEAMWEKDPKRKAELVLLGNCQVVYDEQKHAHEDINTAIPWYAGRPVTAWSLYLDTPTETLRLGKDLPPRPDGSLYPAHLRELTHPGLAAAYEQHSRARGADDEGCLTGSRCQDYRRIEDRMNMIVNVFRTRHDDASLFASPFDPGQRAKIQAGVIPTGKL